jgi:hypothetical protein
VVSKTCFNRNRTQCNGVAPCPARHKVAFNRGYLQSARKVASCARALSCRTTDKRIGPNTAPALCVHTLGPKHRPTRLHRKRTCTYTTHIKVSLIPAVHLTAKQQTLDANVYISYRFVMYVGGNRSPRRKPTTLSHEEWVWPGIEPTTSEVTGADVNFEHRSYHSALWQPHCALWQPHCALWQTLCALWQPHRALWQPHCALWQPLCAPLTQSAGLIPIL